MNKETTKKIAFAVGIVIAVLSLLCFIWSAFSADSYHMVMKEYTEGEYGYSTVLMWYSLYICVTIFSAIIMGGAVFLSIYLYKIDFSLTREEREQQEQQKKEQRKQAKREKLQNKPDKLNN